MQDIQLSPQIRKALCVHLGEDAGTEVANLLQRLASRIEELDQGKVDVIPIVPTSHRVVSPREAA